MCVCVWRHLSSTLTVDLHHYHQAKSPPTLFILCLKVGILLPVSLFSPHSSLSQLLSDSLILWVWFRFFFFFFKCPHVCGVCVCLCVLATRSCPILCYPMDYSPPGSSVHGILQTRILEWVAIMLSKLSQTEKDMLHGVCDIPCVVCFSAWLIFT